MTGHEYGSGPSTLIGRDRELERLRGWLNRGGATLVLVEGRPWSGKTTLLHGLSERADGWRVVPAPESPFVVHRSTTPDQLIAALQRALDLEDARLAGSPRDPMALLERGSERVLLLIDGYEPSSAFHAWFVDSFWPRARSAPALVVVVAGRPDALAPLHELADDRLVLEALDEDAVHGFLTGLGAALEPPLTADEVRTLTDGVAARPDFVGALGRLLHLLQPVT